MAGVGNMKQMVLEKWTTPKNGSGSLVDTLADRYPVYGEFSRSGGNRSYEQNQTKISNSLTVRIYFRNQLDIDANWKVVYDGRRHTVQSIEKIDEKRFNYRLVIDSKGEK